jgi:hypothetical protein
MLDNSGVCIGKERIQRMQECTVRRRALQSGGKKVGYPVVPKYEIRETFFFEN